LRLVQDSISFTPGFGKTVFRPLFPESNVAASTPKFRQLPLLNISNKSILSRARIKMGWGFAVGKTPEVNPSWGQTRTRKASLHSACRSGFTTGTLWKARFFAEQKMRPNEVVKNHPASVGSFQVEALYHCAEKNHVSNLNSHAPSAFFQTLS
jgi:hypothetical protein